MYSLFYFNTSGRAFDPVEDCLILDRVMATYLMGRPYVRVGCDITDYGKRHSVMYYKLQFNSAVNRDFLYYTVTLPAFWQNVLYPQLNPGCGFFAAYTQTIGQVMFKDPDFTAVPSSPPFQVNRVNTCFRSC